MMSPRPTPLQRQRLLEWYAQRRRALPWRPSPSPYATLVSELMLQQTQVDKVIPYYERFIHRFPLLRDLAAASIDEVLSLWSGLGYYRRAHHLHATARAVVERHGGEIPRERALLLALPGVGPYTAGALLSIAFGLPEPLVDGNVQRVLARRLALSADPQREPTRSSILNFASRLVQGPRPGELNQALMELGSLLCRPGSPRCAPCPWRRCCLARRAGVQDQIPLAAKATPKRPLRVVSALLRQGDRLLFVRRRDDGLFSGLWELPSVVVAPSARVSTAATKISSLLRRTIVLTQKVAQIERTLSHRRLRIQAYEAESPKRLPNDERHRLLRPDQISQIGIASAMTALLKRLVWL